MATIVAFFLVTVALALPIVEAENGGFSVNLIHRDSPKSPLYNPSLTSSQRMRNALIRSFNRVNSFGSLSPNSISSEVTPSDGEYLMKVSIGTPPVETLAIADTGSDITWTQCKPCIHCFKERLPLFSPKNSSSYKVVSCASKTCKDYPSFFCGRSNKTCSYAITYGDKSSSVGDAASETFTFDSTNGEAVHIPNIIFGCGNDNNGNFNDGSGIVGLGVGPSSLISQMNSSVQGKFSYCFVPEEKNTSKPSKLNFGEKGIVSGKGVVSTPLFPKYFYYLTLEGISVGGKRLNFSNPSLLSNASKGFQEGNIIIDSGTTVTILPPDFYQRLESEVEKAVHSKPIPDPAELLSLCYKSLKAVDIPIITVHFKGADLKLNSFNSFVKTTEHSICLAFLPSFDDISIFGNVAQANFLVGYDLKKKIVSFKHADCTKQ